MIRTPLNRDRFVPILLIVAAAFGTYYLMTSTVDRQGVTTLESR